MGFLIKNVSPFGSAVWTAIGVKIGEVGGVLQGALRRKCL